MNKVDKGTSDCQLVTKSYHDRKIPIGLVNVIQPAKRASGTMTQCFTGQSF